MKKILFIITKSNFGGAQRYVYDLATHLPADAYDVSVAFGLTAEGKAGRLSRLLLDRNIRTIVIPELSRDVRVGLDFAAFRTLIGLLKDERPDMVHLNSSKAGGLGALAARLIGVPRIIFTIHGLPSDEARSPLTRSLIALFTWLTILLSHTTITVSRDTFERVRRWPFAFGKTILIYNGLETPTFETPSEARKALASIDPTIPESPLIGTIAELHPNKDLITFIDALAHTDAHGVIIGDGELREALVAHASEKKIADRIHFLGYVPDAAKYLRAFTVFLLTSQKEGLPYVLLEAGAAHVPVVATDIPGVRDVILPEYTGLLVPRDPETIAKAYERTVSDAALRHSLTSAMARRIHDTFSLAKMIEKTQALYTK